MYNTIAYFTNDATQVLSERNFGPANASYDTVNALESIIHSAETLLKELRKSMQPETNAGCFRIPPVTNKVATAEGKGDVLLTIQRDLYDARKNIIDGCTRKDVLFRVDTLIDNIENYMAEA